MFIELRMYTCLPGKLPEILKRFETTTLPLFKKYGIRSGPLLTTDVGPHSNVLKYWIEWDSHEQRLTSMAALRVDPVWVAAKAATEKNGPLVASVSNEILLPVPFSCT